MSAPTFKERLAHDPALGQWMDQSRRYILIRPDALMGIFRNLPEPSREAALDALKASIAEQGGDSARAYMAMGGSGDTLLATIEETAPMLGWGRWTISRNGQTLRLDVENSPFAKGYGASPKPVCHAVVGMLEAVSAIVLGAPVIARETTCAATGAARCEFEARTGKV